MAESLGHVDKDTNDAVVVVGLVVVVLGTDSDIGWMFRTPGIGVHDCDTIDLVDLVVTRAEETRERRRLDEVS